MKAPTLMVVALVTVACSGSAYANVGPTSPLYITGNLSPGGDQEQIIIVQGQSPVNGIDTYYGQNEWPIAVYGDVRTAGWNSSHVGGLYDLQVESDFVQYTVPSFMLDIYDSTSDGAHNYMVDFGSNLVYQTDRDYTNATMLFTLGSGVNRWSGITYDPTNHSLWFDGHDSNMMVDYSLSGTLLSSFDVQSSTNGPLAFDPADHTLWLVNYGTKNLEQYSTSGQFLGIDPGIWGIGAEFNLQTIGLNPTPEPGSLILFGSGVLGLAGIVLRKLNL